jgi:TRAP-type uncharacterized transport system fused permease subunit
MRMVLAVLFVVMFLVFCASAQTPAETQKFVDTALAGVQQVGDFYFIPFPENRGIGYPGVYNDFYEDKAKIVQTTLMILDSFQKRKNLSVISFEIERDQVTGGNSGWRPIIHGIFVHAIPVKK